jgi:serine/threonine-protein kinase
MAVVYKALDPRFMREVAIKVLPAQFTHDPTFRARFEREAQAIASLEHPAIVPVYDFGEHEQQPFLVMRYMPGGSLADRLQDGPLSLAQSAFIVRRIAAGLEMAHGQGVIHRDLKPGNILFDLDGNPHLADFGIAKLVEATSTFTGSAVIGTPAYMSPEQAKGGQPVDGRSDIYALGVILYEMITGRAPYEADTPVQVLMKHILEPVPVLPEELSRQFPVAVDRVIERSLAKEVEGRYQTPTQFAQALSRTVAARPEVGEAASPLSPPDEHEAAEDVSGGASPAREPTNGEEPAAPASEAERVLDGAPHEDLDHAENGEAKRPLWVWAAIGVVVLLLLGGGGLWLGGRGGDPTPTATSAAGRLVAAAPTGTATETPVPATETAVPSASPSPSSTPSPSPTKTPTAAAAVTGTTTPTVRVRLQSVNVRGGPGTAYDVVDILFEDDEAPVIAQTENGNWYLIELPDGQRGWLAASVSEEVTALEAVSIALTVPARPTNTPTATYTPAPTQAPPPPSPDDDDDDDDDNGNDPAPTQAPPTPVPPTSTPEDDGGGYDGY